MTAATNLPKRLVPTLEALDEDAATCARLAGRGRSVTFRTVDWMGEQG